ncbi:hypothetical protein [Vitiosangium sp. GDMCC 1.1324]|uniref:hypothetical protein n=1 Tax=Vitiosangium sp. (strain GDMCC 1.1324) TaxID=2138576 RepID=UPI000D3BF3F9|nr:hypothetical protein [Vitiosangium sp. GDMCC 1.1324]PTL76237.1 hypothetical protein DAT35_50220 [Vitiosangium sp. GDMCC 1.1324]
MSVRLAQAQAMISRPGGPSVRGPQQEPRKESAKPGTGKSSSGGASSAGASSAKSASAGKSGGAQGAQRQDGMEAAGAVGARAGGFDGLADKHEPQGRSQLALIRGEAAPSTPQGQGLPARPAPVTVAPDLSREEKVADREDAASRRQSLEDRAKLRAAIVDRLLHGMKDVHGRLSNFLKNPGRLGVVNLTLVLSESSITLELWKEPSAMPERRARMAQVMGVPPEADDATLLRALMAEVHQAFVEFQASRPGRELRQQYEEVLQGYDAANVLPVVPGHDTGPMLAELARVGIAHEPDFSRSLLVDPRLLAVGLGPEEGTTTQVMVSGLTVSQLGTLVAHLRRLNPRLTNKQVCHLLLRASTDLRTTSRKALGQAEVDQVQELARQLLRLQGVELLFV